MNIIVGNTAQTQVDIHLVVANRPSVEQLPGFEIKDHMAEKDAVTWQYGLNGSVHSMIVGLGDEAKLSEESLRTAAGTAGRSAEKHGVTAVSVHFGALESLFEGGELDEAAALRAWVEGWLLGTYSFDKYKSKKSSRHVETMQLRRTASPTLSAAVTQGQIRADGTALARDLGNEPPNELRPANLMDRIVERFEGTEVQVRIFQGEQLEEHQMNGIIAVGKGSKYPPALAEMRYCTDPAKPLIALVGKGITFDTGGISLKSGRDLSGMRIDMGGAAAVIGAMDIISKSGQKVNVVGLVAAAENMPDGGSLLPGEVIRYANGTTVQVKNTDAEGRLVLADALLHAQQLGAADIIDIATLTGACGAALGVRLAGVFGTDDMPATLQAIGNRNGDRSWPLPLEDEYEDLLKSQYADMANITAVSYGGAITAALFLRRFVQPSVRWAHLDIAGPMESENTRGYLPAGPTGYGARLLADYVANR